MRLARRRGVYMALNLLTFPGVTDHEGEAEKLCALVSRDAGRSGAGAQPGHRSRPVRRGRGGEFRGRAADGHSPDCSGGSSARAKGW